MPTLDNNEELRLELWSVICTRDGHPSIECSFEHPCESCNWAIDKIMKLYLTYREAAIREAEKDGWQRTIQTLKIVHDEEYVYGNSSMESAKHWMKQAEKQLASLNQPTKEETSS